MSARAALIDCGLAVILAGLALALTSLGIVAVIATAVIVLLAVTFLVEVVFGRRRRSRGGR